MIWRETSHGSKMPFSSHHIKGKSHLYDLSPAVLTFITYLIEIVFVSFLHCKVTLSRFPCSSPWGEITLYSPHLKTRELCSIYLIYLHRDTYYPLFIYSFMYFYYYEIMGIILFFGSYCCIYYVAHTVSA